MKAVSVYKLTLRKPSGWIVDVYLAKDGTKVTLYNDVCDLLHDLGVSEDVLADLINVDKDIFKALCMYYQEKTNKHWSYSLKEIIQMLREKRVEVRKLDLVDILQEVISDGQEENI